MAGGRICSLLTCSLRICSRRGRGRIRGGDGEGSFRRMSRRCPRGRGGGALRGGGCGEVGVDRLSRSRRSMRAVCGDGGVESLEVLLQYR